MLKWMGRRNQIKSFKFEGWFRKSGYNTYQEENGEVCCFAISINGATFDRLTQKRISRLNFDMRIKNCSPNILSSKKEQKWDKLE